MATEDRLATQLEGEEDHVVHATWSQSGKHLILTVARTRWADGYQQVLLTPAQAEELAAFLVAGPDPA